MVGAGDGGEKLISMDWINLLHQLPQDGIILQPNLPAVSESDLQAVQVALGLIFPDELLHFYRQTNGLGEWLDGMEIGELIWNLERLSEENQHYRTAPLFKDIYLPFDSLLFFGASGMGDLFGYLVENKKVKDDGIWVWNHEDDSREPVAPNLESFVRGWKSGTIAI